MAKTPTLQITEKRRVALVKAIAQRLEVLERSPSDDPSEIETLKGCARALGFEWDGDFSVAKSPAD